MDVIQEKLVTPNNYINGKWIESSTKIFKDVYNSARNIVIAQTPMSSVSETNQSLCTLMDEIK
ncbi:MAG: hypothetical protein ACXAC6_18465 [Candidatus Hodarchaeales archaeon]